VEASTTPIVPVQRAPFASTRLNEPLFTRWIEAKSLLENRAEAVERNVS
jgi:hypothetical protein